MIGLGRRQAVEAGDGEGEEDHGDEDEVGDDGLERPQGDEQGGEPGLQGDRPDRRARPGMDAAGEGAGPRRLAPSRSTGAGPTS